MIGLGTGLGLGVAFMLGGMAGHATEHARSSSFSEAAVTAAAAPIAINLTQAPAPMVVPTLAKATPEKVKAAEPYRAQSASDLECLTQAVYFEARGEHAQGQQAVAQVVLNRVRHPAFPKTVCGVVFQGAQRRVGCQFSFACDGSMRRGREASAWTRAHKVAARALSGAVLGEVGSATHFHTINVRPSWGPQLRRVAQVGMHVFYGFNGRRTLVQVPRESEPRAMLTSLAQNDLVAAATVQMAASVSEAIVEAPKVEAVAAPVAAPAAPEPAPAVAAATPTDTSATTPAA